MSFDELISKRRSIRKYKPEKPEWGLIELMLQSATYAPSPSNIQPVRFVGIESEDVRKKLRLKMIQGKESFLDTIEEKRGTKKIRNYVNAYFRFSEFMFSAPWLFAVGTKNALSFSDRLTESGLFHDKLKKNSDLDISTGLALKGFILKGEELGLGTCILSAPLVYMSDAGSLIDESLRMTCFITVGFPDETPAHIQRKSVSDIYKQV